MKLVVFGLSVSSSWGNGHAVLWRALIRGLVRGGHFVVFFERDVPWYAQHRDLTEIEGGRLVLYGAWDAVRPDAPPPRAGGWRPRGDWPLLPPPWDASRPARAGPPGGCTFSMISTRR